MDFSTDGSYWSSIEITHHFFNYWTQLSLTGRAIPSNIHRSGFYLHLFTKHAIALDEKTQISLLAGKI